MAEPEKRRCATCSQRKAPSEFYANCAECKDCKRARSRNNRALQARKIAAFERFVDALIVLADKSGNADAEQQAVA